jgi:hypothetical protein
MIKRLFLLLILLLGIVTVQAQDEEEEVVDIPYVQLGANFSVPEIDWVMETGDQSVWFINREIDAQIYVTVVDTQDASEAILATIPVVSNVEFDAAFAEGRAGRTSGTWALQLFKSGDTSISAYAMLQSGQVYVVIFAENSANYEAYHYPVRPEIAEPEADQLESTMVATSDTALNAVFSQDVTEARISYPNPDSKYWLHLQYSDTLATSSFLFDGIVFVTLVDGDTSVASTLSNAFDTVFLGFVITPNNGEFLYLGLAFSAVIMLMLLGSMWLRYRNVLKDIELVEQLAEA